MGVYIENLPKTIKKVLKHSFAWVIVNNKFIFHIVVYIKQNKATAKRHFEQIKSFPGALYIVKSFRVET